MGNTTTVRAPEGTVFSEALSDNLRKLFLHDFDIDFFEESTDQYRSYTRKRDSFFEAFLLIIKAIPTEGPLIEIKKYLNWCLDQCNLPPNLSVYDYEASLSRYTALLADVLIDYWECPKEIVSGKNAAVELLNKSAQYVKMTKGCPDIATLSSLSIHTKGEFVLLWDKRHPPCSEETLNELNVIKNSAMSVTPEWFRQLPEYQQTFFHSSESHLKTKSLLKANLSKLQATWKHLKTLYSSTLLGDLAIIATGNAPVPFWFSELSEPHQAVIKSISPLVASLKDVDSNLQALGKLLAPMNQDYVNDLSTLRKLPYWFLYMPEHEQLLLKTSLLEAKNVEDVVSLIPSGLRSLPGLANLKEHFLKTLSRDGEVLNDVASRMSSSHVVSRDMENQPRQIGELHSRRNLKKIIEHAEKRALLIQTLISPLYVTKGHKPDHYLYTQLCGLVKELREKSDTTLYLTNHPFNLAKYLTPTSAGDIECAAVSTGAEKKLSPQAVEKQVAGLDCSENEVISTMVSESIAFTCENSAANGFTQLLQLMEANPLSVNGLSIGRFKQMVNVAFIEAELFLSMKTDFRMYEQLDNEEDLIKKQLIEFFVTHHNQLSQWQGWQSVFASYYHVKNNVDNPSPVLNFTTKICDLAQLNCDYKNLLNSGMGTGTIWDYHGRELWLSSLENLQIIYQDDLSHGFCVSGKDRKSIELIHTDAMLLYRNHYGRWPNINDSGIDRDNFVEIVAELYLTRHVHNLAEQNAAGAEGIKTPDDYWPQDIAYAICRKAKAGEQTLVIDDILASRNEADNIGTVMSSIEPGLAKCVIAAMRLSEEDQKAILTPLKIICQEGPYWAYQKSYSVSSLWSAGPDGVELIRDVLDAPDLTMTESIARVYYNISKRPEISYWRSTDTRLMYDSMLQLLKAEKPEDVLGNTLGTLELIKQKAFKYNSLNSASLDCLPAEASNLLN